MRNLHLVHLLELMGVQNIAPQTIQGQSLQIRSVFLSYDVVTFKVSAETGTAVGFLFFRGYPYFCLCNSCFFISGLCDFYIENVSWRVSTKKISGALIVENNQIASRSFKII